VAEIGLAVSEMRIRDRSDGIGGGGIAVEIGLVVFGNAYLRSVGRYRRWRGSSRDRAGGIENAYSRSVGSCREWYARSVGRYQVGTQDRSVSIGGGGVAVEIGLAVSRNAYPRSVGRYWRWRGSSRDRAGGIENLYPRPVSPLSSEVSRTG
jgi:hypothetical protein